MPNEVLYKVGTAIVLADTTDYSPTAARTLGTRTHQIDVSGLVDAAARQSSEVDLGATRAMLYDVRVNFEALTGGDFTAGGSIDLYASPSHATGNVGNVGYTTGSDAAYAATAGHTLAELLTHLQFIGSAPVAVTSESDGPSSVHVGVWSPTARYVNIVVVNNGGRNFPTAAVEFAIRIDPIIAEIQ